MPLVQIWDLVQLTLTQMLCHKIVHIIFQCKCNYLVLIILQISVPSGTRAASIHSVHWGINPTFKNTTPSFLPSPLLSLQIVQAPPF